MTTIDHLRRASLALALLIGSSCSVPPAAPHRSAPPPPLPLRVIFDTDMGSDCDDAGAMAVLHKLADRGRINVLGVVFSSGRNRHGVGVCDAINTYYGRGDLPLGQYKGDDVGDSRDSFSRGIAAANATYGHDLVDSGSELVATYKKLLRDQPNGSVTVVTLGHPHGLVHLMRDPEGMRLITRKVTRCVSMAYCGESPRRDWNFGRNGAERYTREFLAMWPTAIYFSDAGSRILSGHQSLPATPADNPVREAYRLFDDALTKGRPSWDQVALLSAGCPEYFEVESKGRLEQDGELRTFWNRGNDDPSHHRVRPAVSDSRLQAVIEGLMAEPPLRSVHNQRRAP